MPLDVIDLFAGPGGLGEGFAGHANGAAFRIRISAEMEPSAHATLTLRSFFRHARMAGDSAALRTYYEYCNDANQHPSERCAQLWKIAEAEAKKLTLGESESDAELERLIRGAKLSADQTVLIGGPPCQAYSLVGRARNKGTAGYVPEEDRRHFLYREYLRIVARTRPAVFVMENVKGILSSNVGGRRLFSEILTDLSHPSFAHSRRYGPRYVIHSLVSGTKFVSGMNPDEIDAAEFVVRSEEFGVPQARHRVILLGVREDLELSAIPTLARSRKVATVRAAVDELPQIRSRLSSTDDEARWVDTVRGHAYSLASKAHKRRPELADRLREAAADLAKVPPVGSFRFPRGERPSISDTYSAKLSDRRLRVWLNHESRSHMESDLRRYLYASAFAELYGVSPKGHLEFDLPGLAPAHKNWETGKFADRFRVQCFDRPATTVTSHISKDGHYFIHPDPWQCRSLSVREAARLQSFPDNYFFQGNRTQQYHQVGNAVPPMLADQIARVVYSVLKATGSTNQLSLLA